MTSPVIVTAGSGASIDPVFQQTEAGPRIVGLHVRQAGDTFHFTLDPTSRVLLEGSPELIKADLPFSDAPLLPANVLEVQSLSEGRRHRLRIPALGEQMASRVWWSIQDTQNNGALLGFDHVGARIPLYQPRSQEGGIDLLSCPDSVVVFRRGEGFAVITKGDRYAFHLIFRLVESRERDDVALRFVRVDGRLDIYLSGTNPVDCTFILTPHARRDIKFLGGRRAGSLQLSRLAVAVAEPYPPRSHLAISSLPTNISDFPISLVPGGHEVGASFPLVVLAEHDLTMFPTAGRRSQRVMWDALDAILICGNVGQQAIEWALQNFRYVGVAAHSMRSLNDTLPPAARCLLPRRQGETMRISLDENLLWVAQLPSFNEAGPLSGYARQWSILESLTLDMTIAASDWSPDQLASLRKTWDARLPALPTSADVAVAMVAALINRQRGRAGFDDGEEQPDYRRYAHANLWLCAPSEVDLSGHAEAIIQLTLHGVAEYWAANTFASLRSARSAGPAAPIDEIRYLVHNLIRSWELRDPEASMVLHRDLSQKTQGVGDDQLMRVLAETFLTVFEENLADPLGYLTSHARCINPLVLLVAEGSPGVDNFMTLSAAYWAAFAAAHSATKPSAIVPTLLSNGALQELVTLHRHLRLLIHGYVPNSIAGQKQICQARKAIGEELLRQLEIASTIVLHAAGADRIVAIASVLVDFIPFADTVLGLEVPVSRVPFSSPKTAFVHINFAALSSAAAGALEGSACVLGPAIANDSSETWAIEMQAQLSNLLPSLGLQAPRVESGGDPLSATLERSGVVFFVGHAMASDAWSGLNFGDKWIGPEILREVEWTGKIAILIGCETAALDAANGDISRLLVERGARAVVGATAKISTDAAELFLSKFLSAALAGEAVDYAFFTARRLVVLAEAIAGQGEEWLEARRKAIDVLELDPQAPFGKTLARAGLTWNEAYTSAVYGLSFTLLGGATERIL